MNQNIPSLHPCTLTDLPTLQAISRETFAATFGGGQHHARPREIPRYRLRHRQTPPRDD